MHPILVGLAAFAAIFGGAILGIWLASHRPAHHFDPESRGTVAVSMSVVSTLSALALGLLITQASASFTARAGAVNSISASLTRLDRNFRDFGPPAVKGRAILKSYAAAKLEELSMPSSQQRPNAALDSLDRLTDAVVQLPSDGSEQRFLRQQATGIVQNIVEDRWRLAEQNDQSMPTAFISLEVLWLTLLFVSF